MRKVVSCDCARSLLMLRIFRFDLTERGRGFFDGRECKQTRSTRNDFGETGVLNHDGSACGEVADGAATEPSRARRDVRILRNADLASGLLNVVAVIIGRAA